MCLDYETVIFEDLSLYTELEISLFYWKHQFFGTKRNLIHNTSKVPFH